jgi:hypothetical protein
MIDSTMESERPELEFYGTMWRGAQIPRKHMREAWRRPVRPNLLIEKHALWGASKLGLWFPSLVESDDRRLQPEGVDAETQYEFKAAVLCLNALFPLTETEAKAIAGGPTIRHGKRDYNEAGQAAALQHWHDWLWTGTYDRAERTMLSGASAMYLVGCDRLAQSVEVIYEQLQSPSDA